MQELNKGEVPSELKQQYPQGMNVGLEDRRQEVKRPPTPPRYVEFSGQGVSMDTANTVITQSVQGREYVLPENAPSTRVQIRLSDGRSVRVTIALSSTVRELYNHVAWLARSESVSLVMGRPAQTIAVSDRSIGEAGLEGQSIMQQ